MANSEMTFNEALTRLEEIVSKVKGKDISLDESLELLEEGVRLANICTEKTDHTRWQEEAEGDAGAGSLPG